MNGADNDAELPTQMKAFYLAWPILQTASAELPADQILQTVSAESALAQVAARFLLPWSAYVRLLAAWTSSSITAACAASCSST